MCVLTIDCCNCRRSKTFWLIDYLRDYTFDFRSARDGLLTLENAFFELMDGIPDEEGKGTSGGKQILENPVTRDDIELESIDSKNIHGLWNSPQSRAVFYEIVNSEFCASYT